MKQKSPDYAIRRFLNEGIGKPTRVFGRYERVDRRYEVYDYWRAQWRNEPDWMIAESLTEDGLRLAEKMLGLLDHAKERLIKYWSKFRECRPTRHHANFFGVFDTKDLRDGGIPTGTEIRDVGISMGVARSHPVTLTHRNSLVGFDFRLYPDGRLSEMPSSGVAYELDKPGERITDVEARLGQLARDIIDWLRSDKTQ